MITENQPPLQVISSERNPGWKLLRREAYPGLKDLLAEHQRMKEEMRLVELEHYDWEREK